MSAPLVIVAPNGLMATLERYKDDYTGGCCWTSDLEPAAKFASREEAIKGMRDAGFPIVAGWIRDGSVELRAVDGT